MHLFTAIPGLAIAVSSIIGPPLGLAPTTPPTQVVSAPALTARVTGSGPVMTGCEGCGNSDWCKDCSGSGQGHGGPRSTCSSCQGTGTCQDCLEPEEITPPGLHIVR
jgi:hypothetical protein